LKENFIRHTLRESVTHSNKHSQEMIFDSDDLITSELSMPNRVSNLKVAPKQNAAKRKMKSRKMPEEELSKYLSAPENSSDETPEKPTINEESVYSLEIIKTVCNRLFDEINKLQCNIKMKYYELGMYLIYAKRYCVQKQLSFVNFVDDYLANKSRSQINKYIRFYQICKKHECLIYNELSMTQIEENYISINKYFSN